MRRLAAAAGLALLVLAIVVAPASGPTASAQDPTTRTGAIPLPDPLTPTSIEVVSQTTFVGPGSTFSLVLDVPDDPDVTLSLTLHEPVTSRSRFGATLAGDGLGGVIQQVGPVPVRDLPTEASGSPRADRRVVRIDLAIPDDATAGTPAPPPNPFSLEVTNAGTHPLALSLSDGTTDDTLVTHVVRPPTAGATPPPPLSVVTLVRLDAPIATEADGAPRLTPVETARLSGVIATLADTATAATVHTSGAVLTALATAEPATPFAEGLAGRLLTPTWVPVGVSDLVAAGREAFLDRQLLTGGGTATDLVGDRGSPDSWVLDDGVDPDGLSALVARGVRTVIVPEDLAEPLDPGRFPATLTQSFEVADATGTTVPALQTDLALTSLLGSSDQPAVAANRVLADLAVIAGDFPDLRRAVVLDTGADVDPEILALVLAGLAPGASGPPGTTPLLEGRTIGAALASASSVGDGFERTWLAEPPADLDPWPEAIDALDAGTAALVSTLEPRGTGTNADAVVASVNRLALASGGRDLDQRRRQQLVDDADSLIGANLAAIGIPAQGTVTLTADTGVVPVTLVNGLPDPVRVRLTLQSDKLEFPDGQTVEFSLDPGANRREVAVIARATGAFPVGLDLRTGDGQVELATGRLTVRSNAFSGLGLVLSVLAGVFLAGWWALHLRSVRRSRQLVGSSRG